MDLLKRLAASLLAIVLCTLCISNTTLAASQTSDNSQSERLPHWAVLAVDGKSTIDQALRSNNWQRGHGTASFSYDAQPKWLHYQVPPAGDLRIFNIENPWLQRIDVYLMAGTTVAAKYETGTNLPQSTRPISGSGFGFGIDTSVTDIYIFDHARSASYFPVALTSAAQYSSTNSSLNAFHGMYYGVLLIMILYNIAIFFGTQDRAYVYYSLYAASLMLFLTTADGTGALFLWPAMPAMHDFILPLGWGMAFVFLIEFANRFLGLKDHNPFRRIQQVGYGLTGLIALTVMITADPTAYIVQTVMSAALLMLLVTMAIYGLQRQLPNASIFLAAHGIFAIGAFSHIAMLFAWIEPSLLVQHAIHLGSIGELSLLSMGLVRHLRATDQARFAAFQHSQHLSRRNKELNTAKALAEEHRQLQKSLQHAQKLKTIGQLAGGFAHDFNNILASILGFTELARDKTGLADRATLLRYLNEIQQSGERGANLVKQLLVYSRSTSSSEPQELNLGNTLRQAQELLRGSLPATVSINTHIDDEGIRLFMDPEQLQQVLVNLCINAAESMHNRGQIDIRLDRVQPKSLSCTSCLARFSGEYLAIKIEDNGAGIKGNAEEMFTPFQTTKEVGQGTGLGLSVVHGIVHEHGGHVHAANRAEGGARFVVYLPPQSATAKLGEKRTTKRILLIEDDPSVASYLGSLLDEGSYQTMFASMPTEALETFVADPDAFDLIITDYLMPQGTGLELAEDIHALRPDLPVILTTGNANNLDKNEVASADLAGIFEKPLNSEQLLARIKGILAS